LKSEFGFAVAGVSPRRKNQSEPAFMSPEQSGQTGTSPEQTGVKDIQLARGKGSSLPTLRFQRRSESSEKSAIAHSEPLDVVPGFDRRGPGRAIETVAVVTEAEAPAFRPGRVHNRIVQRADMARSRLASWSAGSAFFQQRAAPLTRRARLIRAKLIRITAVRLLAPAGRILPKDRKAHFQWNRRPFLPA